MTDKLFVARDYNGQLWMHFEKPYRQGWVWQSRRFFEIPRTLFPELTWETKPIEVELKKIRK